MKNILITGSTDGIGKIAALQLAKAGHQVYLHGRNQEKLHKVVSELKVVSGNENIHGFVADFSELAAVKEMTESVQKALPQLDVLINNAGVYNAANSVTSAGYDIRFVVNYFAPYILTNALLPLLKKSDDPRVINLSSAAQALVMHEALEGKIMLPAQAAYAQSKLALTMWSMHLAKQEENITVIPVNPGSLLNTKMVQEAFGRYWSSADKGADILTELATAPNLIEKSGTYFDNDQERFSQAHEDAYDTDKIADLLQTTNAIV